MQPSVDQEAGIETVGTVEERIEGREQGIKLKRIRNSLLKISKCIPPEILGYIFLLTVARDQDHSLYSATHFEGSKRRPYVFLLVCHHWFEVASNIEELWSHWGDTLEDWNKWCHRHKASPVDLVLDGHKCYPEVPSNLLQGELRDRATRDKIRQIKFKGNHPNFMGFILSCLTPDGEGVQEKRLESLIFYSPTIPEELPNFFARSRLPFLRYLEISGTLTTPLWDHLASQTTRLTVLSLQSGLKTSHPLTLSWLIPILIANPNLQDLSLSEVLPDKVEYTGNRVPLGHLKTIVLRGKFDSIFQLLRRLELPAVLDYTSLTVDDSTSAEIDSILVPYMKDLFRRDVRLKRPLLVKVSGTNYVTITVGLAVPLPKDGPMWPLVTISVAVTDQLHREWEQLAIDLTECIPQERVETLHTKHIEEVPEGLFVEMANLKYLWLEDLTLWDGFLQVDRNGRPPDWMLFPSLVTICLKDVTVGDDGDEWQPLIEFLEVRASEWYRLPLLYVTTEDDMCEEVADQIESLVGMFNFGIDPADDRVADHYAVGCAQ
jgi:hypothetical protein